MLARLGLRADLAADVAEAPARVQDGVHDLILMDMQMPDVDGPDVTVAIRRLLVGKSRPQIVAMTADVLQEDRQRCLAAGMDDFLTKPISSVALRRAIQAAVERQGAAAGPRRDTSSVTLVGCPGHRQPDRRRHRAAPGRSAPTLAPIVAPPRPRTTRATAGASCHFRRNGLR